MAASLSSLSSLDLGDFWISADFSFGGVIRCLHDDEKHGMGLKKHKKREKG